MPADVKRPLPAGFYGHLHNFYIQYAAERGIPALLFLLWLIGLLGWDCASGILRIGKRKSTQLFILRGSIAIIIGILVGGLFEHNLGLLTVDSKQVALSSVDAELVLELSDDNSGDHGIRQI